MKKIILFIAISVFSHSFCQINFNTGSVELDADLNQVNISAKANLSSFKADLKIDFQTNDIEINKLFSLKMEPAEVKLALSIADITKKKVDEVADSYTRNKGKGWGVIAKDLGIKPGSKEFHALKGKNKKVKGNNGNKGGNGKGKK
jgi:hypothetical protein